MCVMFLVDNNVFFLVGKLCDNVFLNFLECEKEWELDKGEYVYLNWGGIDGWDCGYEWWLFCVLLRVVFDIFIFFI